MTPFPYQDPAFTTKRRFAYTRIVGETKRAWIVKLPKFDKPVRLPKLYTDFDEIDGKPVFWVSLQVAEFVGLVQEKTL